MSVPWYAGSGLVVAHRGGGGEAPEATLYAIRKAFEAGASAVELDVRLTKDGKVVLFHDPTVDRVTDGRGFSYTKSLAELRALDPGHRFSPDGGRTFPYRGVAAGDAKPPADASADEFRIPTLEEILERFRPPLRFTLELKRTPGRNGLEDAVAPILESFGRDRDILAGSFDSPTVLRLKRRLPGIATYMTSRAVVRFLFPAMFSQEFRHDAFAVPPTLRGIPLVRPAFVRRGHALGLPVHVWTINRPEAMRAFFSMDVNGIVTDRVRAAVEVAGALRV